MMPGLHEGQELQINDLQMKNLQMFIAACPDGTPFAKQAIIWLLRQSHRLSDDVAVYFPPDVPENEQVADFVHSMNSCGGQTHICYVFRAMGSHMMLVEHCGYCLGTDEDKEKHPGGYTIWLSRDWYDHNTPEVCLDMGAIYAIDLKKIKKD